MPGVDPPYVEPIQAIVFDLDGTLITSRHDFPKMRRAIVQMAELHGVPPGALHPGETVPGTLEAARSALAARAVSEGTLYRFEADVNRRIDEIEMEALPSVAARPGAVALLQELTARSYRLGLLTRSCEAFTRQALRAAGLEPYFPFLRSRSAPGPAKPSPESLEILLQEMGIPPHEAIVVGDHPMDGETARGARVRFYGVLEDPGAPPLERAAERLKAAGAVAVARDLPELARQLGLPKLPGAPPPAPNG
ncbi:MAG TPA: HAD family hydrolase [Thermoplasmata archaeon]|nr:HAD family hydrolase [Thermoplasmata archaeon]